MIKWAPYTFVRLTAFLIAGILLALYTPVAHYPELITYTFASLLLLYLLLYIFISTLGKGLRFRTVFGLLTLSIISSFGILRTYQCDRLNKPDHILHQANSFTFYQGTITNAIQEKERSYQTEVTVEKVFVKNNWMGASGKVLIHIRKNASKPTYGQQILVRGMPQRIAPPANPDEFNYRQYWQYQGIHHHQFLSAGDFSVTGFSPSSYVLHYSLLFREYADETLKRLIPSPQEYGIVAGLVLGIKDGLDNSIKAAYSSAGAMHILAVSGAHVLIVFQILVFGLGNLRKTKHGNLIFTGIVLTLLWFYAFVTGLSPSVLRAVLMFSIVVIGQAAKRQKSTYNTLALSAFILLCYNPLFIMDVGFQLSYAAVLGLVYLQPKLTKAFDFDNKQVNYIWGIISMSIAAQLATFPISLFYFCQFPTYFLLSNLIVVPLSSLILPLGLFTLAFSWVPYLSTVAAFVLHWSVWLLNKSVFVIEALPGAVISGFSVSWLETILLYVLIIVILAFLYYKKLYYWTLATVLVIICSSITILESWNQQKQRQLTIYALPNHWAVNLIEGKKHFFIADSALLKDPSTIRYHFTRHWQTKGITESNYIDAEKTLTPEISLRKSAYFSLLIWHGKTFVFLHKKLPYDSDFLQTIKIDYLVIQKNALKHVQQPFPYVKNIIIDSSNKKWLASRLKEEAINLGIPCHSTHEDGAFILEE